MLRPPTAARGATVEHGDSFGTGAWPLRSIPRDRAGAEPLVAQALSQHVVRGMRVGEIRTVECTRTRLVGNGRHRAVCGRSAGSQYIRHATSR